MRYILLTIILAPTMLLQAQVAKRELPQIISMRGNNEYAPRLTADGTMMIYLSDYSQSGKPELKITFFENGKWSQPEDMNLPNASQIQLGGYDLSPDGSKLVISSRQSPGIGSYDLFFLERKGKNAWSQPINPGKPLNSPQADVSPSLSADGKFLYFSRCEKVQNNQESGCQLFVAEARGNGYWNEPVELELDIDAPSLAFPNIYLDNQTLYFSAETEGNGYDFFVSRKGLNGWEKPKALSFINTKDNEKFLDFTVFGDILYTNFADDGSYDLFMVKVPEQFQPSDLLFVDGNIESISDKLLLEVVDVISGKTLEKNVYAEAGPFALYLPEGHLIDISMVSNQPGKAFFSSRMDISNLSASQRFPVSILLPDLQKGESYNTTIAFQRNSANLAQGVERELDRLIRLLQMNKNINLVINVYQPDVQESEVAEMGLTELRFDTTLTINRTRVMAEPDTLVSNNLDSAMVTLQVPVTDSLYVLDTTQTVKKIYHNDLTDKRAKTVADYFREQGVPEHLYKIFGRGQSQEVVFTEEEKEDNCKVIYTIE